MSGDINDYAQVNISASQANVTQKGFGLPLYLSHSATWPERTREYANTAAVQVDFPTANAPEVLVASAIFGQTPCPPKMLIGRANDAKPTQKFEITPVVLNNYTYKFTFNDVVVSFTSGGSATAAAITAGLKTAFDLLGLAVTSSQQNTNTTLRLVANNPGDFFRYKTTDRANMPVVQNHADPGIAAPLAAIALERNDWFALVTSFNSLLYVAAAAAYANANKKLYGYQTIDSVVPETPVSGTDDVGELMQSLNYNYVFGLYSDGTADFIEAGLFGSRLPKTPGRATWKFAQLSGVPVSNFTSTERTNMRNKNIGFFETTAGVSIVNDGKLASGRFIDFQIFLDYFASRVQTRIFTVETTNDKVPYDDGGITLVSGCVRAEIKAGTLGQFAPIDPNTFTVTEPKAADVIVADRTARVLNGVNFSFRYTGAIHSAIVNGVASL